MKSKDLFNLAVRLLGLVFVYQAFTALPVAIFDGARSVLISAYYLIIAWWLLGGAPMLIKRANSDEAPAAPATDQVPGTVQPKTDA